MNQGGYSVTELMGRGWGWPFLGIQIRHLRLRMFIASLLHVVASTIIVCFVCKWSRCSVRQRLSINQEVSTWPGLKIAQSSVDRDCDLISVTHSSFILTRLIISPVPWSQSVNVSMFYSRNKDGFFYIILSDQLCTFFFLYFSRDCILHLYIYKPWVREVALACLIYSRSPTESRTRWGITTRRRMWKLLIISYANVWKHLKLNSSIHRYVFFFSPINSSTLEWSCEDTMCYGTRWQCMGRSLSSYTWKIRFVLELILP